MSNSISKFIEAKLSWLNVNHRGVIKATDDSYLSKVGDAIDRANSNLDKISFEGVEISKETIEAMRIAKPEVFRNKPLVYISQASNGAFLEIEITD